jgi:DNA-binding response OmpR family regulator
METANQNLPKSILIVEDEPALAEALADTLKDEGYDVATCPNGEEGLKQALETHPTLILLDILMPKKDGLAMMTELKREQTPPISSVIFFTNLNQMDKIADAVDEGAEGYIIKAEASLEEVVKRVNEFFAKKEGK